MNSKEGLIIRAANPADLAAINTLYNHYALNSPCTFDLEPWTLEQRTSWFNKLSPPWLLFVAEQNEVLQGFAYSAAIRKKAGYATSVETTIYVDDKVCSKGVGEVLLKHLLGALSSFPLHRAYAGIALPNDPSIGLHEKLGYRHIGTFEEVGIKFGEYFSVAWYQYEFDGAPP
jgi:phosphinothricin acetyltransferase